MLNYLTKTGKCGKTSCEAERLTPASRQNSLNFLYLNIKIVGAMHKLFSHRLRKYNKGLKYSLEKCVSLTTSKVISSYKRKSD